MPEFIREMVARGFWWAILAGTIVCGIFNVLGLILRNINKLFGSIVRYLPGVLFNFYIWHIREHTGWLVFAILGVISLPFSIFQSMIPANIVKAMQHFKKARKYFDQRRYDEAIIGYKRAFELNPEFASAMVECADAWICKGNYREAKMCLLEALVLNPNIAKAHNNLGIIYDMEGDTERARKEFVLAAEIDPKYTAHVVPEGAGRSVGFVLSDFEKDKTLLGDGYDYQGAEMQSQGNYSAALQLHLKAIKAGTSEPAITYNNIASALIHLGDYSQAIHYCDESLRIDPNYSGAMINREIAQKRM